MWRLVILLLLVGCAEPLLLEEKEGERPSAEGSSGGNVRPDIPRVEVPEQPTAREPTPEYRQFLDTSAPTRPSELAENPGIYAGDTNQPFLFGEKLGELIPVLRGDELAFLRMAEPNYHGEPFRYRAYVRFDFDEETSGELRFVRDEDTDLVESELFFAEEQPIFEYAYFLQTGALPLLEGVELDFLGTRYLVERAENSSVTLVSPERELLLSDDSRLVVDRKRYSDTTVEVDPWHIIIRYTAPSRDDGVRIKAGESLQQHLLPPLLAPFDIVYEGVENLETAVLHLRNRGESMKLEFVNRLDQQVSVDVVGVQNGTIEYGDEESTLHVQECASLDDFCIGVGDKFFLSTRDKVTWPFEFRGVNSRGDTLTLSETATKEKHVVELKNTSRLEGSNWVREGSMRLHESTFRIRLLHDEDPLPDQSRISVDMDGSGGVNGRESILYLAGDQEVEFDGATLVFESPRHRQLEAEEVRISFKIDGEDILAGVDLELFEVEHEDLYQATTARGTLLTLESEDGEYGEKLTLEYSPDFRAGLVRIVG